MVSAAHTHTHERQWFKHLIMHSCLVPMGELSIKKDAKLDQKMRSILQCQNYRMGVIEVHMKIIELSLSVPGL